MGISTNAVFTSDGFDRAGLRRDCVRFGFQLQLPFRLRTGPLFPIPDTDGETTIWLCNPIPVPAGTENYNALKLVPMSGLSHLFTRALVIVNNPDIPDSAVDQLRNGSGDIDVAGDYYTQAREALNTLICGYSITTKNLACVSPLKMLTARDFFDGLSVQFTWLAPRGTVLTEKDVRYLLARQPEVNLTTLSECWGDVDDLPPESFGTLHANMTRVREHVFHEFAFRAKYAMISEDYHSALVLACAALEGAHAAFLRQALTSRSPNIKDVDSVIRNLMREQGIHAMLGFTCLAFMDTEKRPPADAIARCMKGIEMRNGILHAKRKKSGYAIRGYTLGALSDAYSGVLKVYQRFADALSD